MAGDAFKRVNAGDPLDIPAEWINGVSDAAQAYQRSKQSAQAGPQGIRVPEGLILVSNDSGADVDRFNVLGIEEPIIGPDDNLDEFKNRPSMSGVTPTVEAHTGAFAVVWEPIAKGKIGRAFVFGACVVKVYINNVDDRFADVADDDVTQLSSGASGAASILWTEPAVTGTQWAYVRIGGGGSPLPRGTGIYKVLMLVDDLDPGTPGWDYPRFH